MRDEGRAAFIFDDMPRHATPLVMMMVMVMIVFIVVAVVVVR